MRASASVAKVPPWSIVIGIGAGRHALEDVPSFQYLAVRAAAVLAPTAALKEQAGCDGACAEGLLEGVCDKLGAHEVGSEA